MMWRGLSDWIHRVSNGWAVAASLLIFLLFIAWVLPSQASKAEAATGGVGSPDMSFFYSADELYQMASRYGKDGREAYIRARLTFDLVWPLVYGIFLSMGISWTFRKAFSGEGPWKRANLVPVLGVLFDFLENVSTSLVMARYPRPTAVLDGLASGFTMVKWILVAGSFALFLIGIVMGLLRWVGSRNNQ